LVQERPDQPVPVTDTDMCRISPPPATRTLIMAAEGRGPLMHARVGVVRALNRHVDRVFNADRNDTHWAKRKFKRDE
jgi:hypothetical protein